MGQKLRCCERIEAVNLQVVNSILSVRGMAS